MENTMAAGGGGCIKNGLKSYLFRGYKLNVLSYIGLFND